MLALSPRRAPDGDSGVDGVDGEAQLDVSQSRRSPLPFCRRSTAPVHAAPVILSALPMSPSARRAITADAPHTASSSPALASSSSSSTARTPRPSFRATSAASRPSLSTPVTSAPVFCSSPAPELTLEELSMEPLSLVPTLPTSPTSPNLSSSPAQPLRSLEASPQRRQKSSRTLSEYALAAVMAQATDADALLGISKRVLAGEGGSSGVGAGWEGAVALKSNKHVLKPLPSSRRTATLTSAPQLAELNDT